MNKLSKYAKSDYKILSVDINDTEYDKMIGFLINFVEKKVPYNYTDIIRLSTSMFLMDEEDYESVNDIKNIFCSQAATFILKKCLNEDHCLFNKLQLLNSRFTTPTDLYDVLASVCRSAEHLYIK